MNVRILYINIIFILSLAGSFFASIKIGSFSISALITFSAMIIPFFLLKTNIKKSTIKILSPFVVYCVYDFSSFLWGPITKSVIQDFAVWSGMLMLFLISSIPLNEIYNKIIRIMEIGKYPFLVILSYFLITKIDSPATMMLSVLFFSYLLAKFLTKRITTYELLIMCYLIIVPIVTGSRIIYITEIVILFIFILFFYGNRHSLKDKFKRIIFIIFSFLIIFIIAFSLQDRINSVMGKGDGANVGGVKLNTSGRSYIWSVVYKSAQTNMIFGLGQDGPPEMLKYPKWAHPHNDYLRLLHHNGLIGLILWLVFFFNILFYLLRRIKYSYNDEYKSYYLFNFIFLFAILMIMITDNPIVYSYIMYPLMIISGSSIALHNIEKNTLKKEINE